MYINIYIYIDINICMHRKMRRHRNMHNSTMSKIKTCIQYEETHMTRVQYYQKITIIKQI